MPFNPVGLPLEYCSRQYRQELKKQPSKPINTSTRTTQNVPDSSSTDDRSPVPLWSPPDPEAVPMSQYRHRINQKFSQSLKDSHDLHTWTVNNPHQFWIDLYDYCGIIPPLPKHTKLAYNPNLKLRDLPTFFPGLKLNYAENVLVPNTMANPDAVALVGIRENGLDKPENITWRELTELVRMTRSAMVHRGIKQGDVIAALMANSIWIVVLFLASASIGAIFTSVAPDLGVSGCVSRFAQVEPKWLFVDTDLAIRGTRPSMLGKVQQILASLAGQTEGGKKPSVVFVPTTHKPHLHRNIDYIRPLNNDSAISLSTFLNKSRPSDKMTYTRLHTSHPLVIVYSSGTTGEPKCIISPHMSILNYKKIALLHNSLGPRSTVFQYSSTSWILWNVMNGHLSVGAKVVCYDGGALYPDPSTLLKICESTHATYWGTSPRYLLELEQSGILDSASPNHRQVDLSSLRLITTTGATLTRAQFLWFYSPQGISPPSRGPSRQIHLSSVAGGTDIASSWIATDPAGPVFADEMQMWALGHACDILDSETGESLVAAAAKAKGQVGDKEQEKIGGELVCRAPFPSMPCGFWRDTGNRKYREAYFERFPLTSSDGGKEAVVDYLDVWTQHDFTTLNPRTHGLQILGRSDGVLNPSGIRFGSSEIYNVVEGPLFNSAVSDSLCVSRRRPHDADEAVFLFLVMAPGHEADFGPEFVQEVKGAISSALSPRHVPKFVERVDEIPYTVNGKKVEVVVKKIISGKKVSEVKVSSTIRNPACLVAYERFTALEREVSRRGPARL